MGFSFLLLKNARVSEVSKGGGFREKGGSCAHLVIGCVFDYIF